MPITGQGWELLVQRKGLHTRKGGSVRTWGTYAVTIDGEPQADLQGFMAETIGPGDNAQQDNGRRIEAGHYPLATQFGHYVSIGYSTGSALGAKPMPALLLLGTNKRVGILIHPAHPPNLYISSVGCLNPTAQVTPKQNIDFFDARRRVIALINSLRAFQPSAFTKKQSTAIPHAAVIVEGEPSVVLAGST
jgi:hypothetical protein